MARTLTPPTIINEYAAMHEPLDSQFSVIYPSGRLDPYSGY